GATQVARVMQCSPGSSSSSGMSHLPRGPIFYCPPSQHVRRTGGAKWAKLPAVASGAPRWITHFLPAAAGFMPRAKHKPFASHSLYPSAGCVNGWHAAFSPPLLSVGYHPAAADRRRCSSAPFGVSRSAACCRRTIRITGPRIGPVVGGSECEADPPYFFAP